MTEYLYSNYSINLDNRNTFILIKIINNTDNYFFEKKIIQSDIDSFTLDKYIIFVKNCLSNKKGYTIKFNEYDNKIDMITKFETELIVISEIITLDKFTDLDIKILQVQNRELCKEIEKIKNENEKLLFEINKINLEIDKLKYNIDIIKPFINLSSQGFNYPSPQFI